MKLSNYTKDLLADIEARIDPETEDDYLRQWDDFFAGRFAGDVFIPRRARHTAPGVELKKININDALADFDLMLARELVPVSEQLAHGCGNLGVRANYGTSIIPSLFGAELFIMPYATDTLPATQPLHDTDAIRALVDAGVPKLERGFGERVFQMGEVFAEVFAHYPKIRKYVQVYHPDAQGPLDLCEVLWGSDMFYAFYDEPELLHDTLGLLTDTYVAFMDRWFAMFPQGTESNTHWQMRFPGRILLRSDSAMNISPETYREFVLPHDRYLLDYYDGGAVHFCGRGDHYIEDMCRIPKLRAINVSQPHLNDMETIYRATVDRALPIIGLEKETAERDARRRPFYGRVMAV